MHTRSRRLKGAPAMAAVLAMALVTQAAAQAAPPEKKENPMAAAMNGVTQRFLAAAPDVGETLPADLEVFTAAGEKVQLRSLLRGHHTVLVMGCLT